MRHKYITLYLVHLLSSTSLYSFSQDLFHTRRHVRYVLIELNYVSLSYKPVYLEQWDE